MTEDDAHDPRGRGDHLPGGGALPVTILTGFLGSGKTTVLNHLLRNPAFADTAVLVNEFGEVGLDHLLVAALASEDIVLLNAGCICCTVRSDLIETLGELWKKREDASIPRFARVLIETTGLADPAPILHTLLTETSLAKHYVIDGIVTTVDSLNAERQLDEYPECLKQVAVADRLLVTKSDLASRKQVREIFSRLRGINQRAPILLPRHGAVSPDALLGARVASPAALFEWLQEHDAGGPPHSFGAHNDRITTFVIESGPALALHRFVAWIERLLATEGDRILRVKGVLSVAGVDNPVVIHGVQHVFYPLSELPAWPDGEARSCIVMIGKDLSPEAITDDFRSEVIAKS